MWWWVVAVAAFGTATWTRWRWWLSDQRYENWHWDQLRIRETVGPAGYHEQMGFIYAIEDERGRIKLGCTNGEGAENRLRELQVGNADLLHLRKSRPVEDPEFVERCLHRKFAACRVRPNSEWFNPSEEERVEIDKIFDEGIVLLLQEGSPTSARDRVLSIRLAPELEKRFIAQAQAAGESKSGYAKRLLAEALE